MNRLLLALAALVVLGGAVGLLLWLGQGTTDATGPATAPKEPAIVATVPAPTSTRPHAGVNVTSGAAATGPEVEAEAPREYTVGEVQIRDHRSGSQAPIDVPPNIHPPEARRIPSTLTAAITTQVRNAIRECAASVPPEVRGTNPHVDGLISIDIKNKQAQVTKTAIQLRDVVGAAVDPTKQCIEQKSQGLHVDTDEADLTDYGITISFRLP
jgi:hypothetical protein